MFLEHLTTEGERWDQIAWKYYGDPHDYGRIVAANPHAPITPTLPGGLRLNIPIIERAAAVAPQEKPPWLR